MSAVTAAMLMEADPAAVERQALAWLRMAGAWDDACEELIRGSRDLEDVWTSGPAAQAAAARAGLLRAQTSNAYPAFRRIGDALRLHADTLRSLQHQARALSDEAAGQGVHVDLLSGAVAVAPGTTPAAGSQVTTIAHGYADQLRTLLQRAADSDASTANTILVNLPDPRTGFGVLAQLPVTEAAVREQQGRRPQQVNQWWQSLTPAQQEQAIADFPELIGWLDGIPSDDRNTANRLVLTSRLTSLRQQLDEHSRRYQDLLSRNPQDTLALGREAETLAGLRLDLATLDQVTTALDSLGANGYLLGVDPAADGKVIIAVGNPDTARHTGVWVPGLGTTVQGNTVDNVTRMQLLQQKADSLTQTPGDVSTVYWLGYDAPDLDNLSVAGEQRSRAGAGPYLSFMDGMRATHDPGPSHLVAMGHSYGSTVVGQAALSGRLPVDDILVEGSPGMHTDRAVNLLPDARHVWAGSAPNDPVSETSNITDVTTWVPIAGPLIGYAYDHGHDISPHEAEFGANQYVVDTSGHTHYWEPNSESLANQAFVLAGQYSQTTRVHGQAPPDIVP